jgi:hypothetical protein
LTEPFTKNDTAPARALLESAYKELLAASKVAVGDDGATLMAAATLQTFALDGPCYAVLTCNGVCDCGRPASALTI